MLKSSGVKVLVLMFFIAICLAPSLMADMEDNLTYQGDKARITVGKIKDKAKCSYNEAAAVGEMLSTALSNHDKFIVLASQEEVDELIDEIELGESEYVESGRGADKGLMEGADILVTGAITAWESNAGGGGGALGGIAKKAFGSVGVKKKTAEVNMDIKIIDIRTRRVLKAKSLKAKSNKWKVGSAGGGWTKDIVMVGALGAYSNEPMEDAIREVLRKAVAEIADETPEEYFRYKGQGQYTTEYGSSGGSGGATGQEASSGLSNQGSAPAPGKKIADDMTLYTKYDFVPGNKVIFYDDMKGEEEGEFPYRWNLERGVYEIVRLGKSYWIMCTDNGYITPKMPKGPLPEKYTVELEYYINAEGNGNYHYIEWINAEGKSIGSFATYSNDDTWLTIMGSTLSDKSLPAKLKEGVHVMRIMATSRSIKCYIDNIRVANVPKVENFHPVGFRLHHRPVKDPENPTLFRHFRFAEGGKSMREQLDETGKIITHGILFDVNSFTIKAESYKTLQKIGYLLEDDSDLRLSIEGHTDSDGGDEDNQTLSQNRAESVRTYLMNKFEIAGDRLEAKGWGQSKPIDTNESSEGKANNRRVELVKL